MGAMTSLSSFIKEYLLIPELFLSISVKNLYNIPSFKEFQKGKLQKPSENFME